ncbi:extracellular solute-binding protein [Kibdelosporangium persicum]|uniref:Probable sugar-binding periplasmic protein n=1 Tax=Kibdelosporangium persicum TaxID=2698649 RepID=A0ABX2F0U2_9PSEU|nr:extracellular solute-binding protein [Kibdelosporangium persicum]NRN64902.1 Periplasmic substrate-binding component of ABC-type sugar transport system [Kibdelosporangium persicum]
MRKASMRVLLVSVALLVASCSGAAGGGGGTSGDIGAAPAKDADLTLTVYSKFADREYREVTATLETIRKKFPNIKINHQGNQDDDKLTQSIQAGNPPDVAISFYTDNLGNWCHNGAFQDLQPYIDRDRTDVNVIPQAVRDYTSYQGKRCAMPLLADIFGFYYNKDMFAAAGLPGPPKTTDDIIEYSRKLTRFAPDGSIEVAGFLPSMPFYGNLAEVWAPSFGAKYLNAEGKSGLAGSKQWQELFEFQKKLVDFYGKEKLERFKAGLGDEYSPDNAFHKGKIAMMFDGEFRTAFLADQAPSVNYGTAPAPMSPSNASMYGGGLVTGTIIAIPKGVKNPGASWELIKHMTLDTDAIVQLSNGIKNMPTTADSITSPNLQVNEQFRTFLDIYSSGKLVAKPSTAIGDAHLKAVNDFAEKWIAGTETDLRAGLKKVDDQINDALAQK